MQRLLPSLGMTVAEVIGQFKAVYIGYFELTELFALG
jgi:hypothetical protein